MTHIDSEGGPNKNYGEVTVFSVFADFTKQTLFSLRGPSDAAKSLTQLHSGGTVCHSQRAGWIIIIIKFKCNLMQCYGVLL